jgi:predicted RNase H-like HicB family nuclease
MSPRLSATAPARTAVDQEPDPAVLARVRSIMRKPYHKTIVGDDADGYLGMVTELDGCVTAGETEAEALELLQDAMEAWLIRAVEAGTPVPEPTPAVPDVSGKMLLRMPRSLHQRLLQRAAEEGTSANQLAVAILARGL